MNPITLRPIALVDAPVEVEESLVPPLPSGWVRLAAPAPSFHLRSPGNAHHDLMVLLSAGRELDGRLWLHVSVSHQRRMPSWEDMQLVRDLFVGDRYAYQVHPPRSEHYTLTGPGRAGRVLHLWAPLEGEPPLPDFLAARGGSL